MRTWKWMIMVPCSFRCSVMTTTTTPASSSSSAAPQTQESSPTELQAAPQGAPQSRRHHAPQPFCFLRSRAQHARRKWLTGPLSANMAPSDFSTRTPLVETYLAEFEAGTLRWDPHRRGPLLFRPPGSE